MGSGKTLVALNILKNLNGRFIIVGNNVSQNAFLDDMELIDVDPKKFQLITMQRVANMDEADLIDFFQDSYIIIDEYQNLYSSSNGLNS